MTRAALKNLIAHRAASGGGKRVMLAAHMDEIGLMVSYVDEMGFLRFTPIGGVNLATLVGGRVQFADGAVGVIAPEDPKEFRKTPQLAKLYIDVGASSREEAEQRLRAAGRTVTRAAARRQTPPRRASSGRWPAWSRRRPLAPRDPAPPGAGQPPAPG